MNEAAEYAYQEIVSGWLAAVQITHAALTSPGTQQPGSSHISVSISAETSPRPPPTTSCVIPWEAVGRTCSQKRAGILFCPPLHRLTHPARMRSPILGLKRGSPFASDQDE